MPTPVSSSSRGVALAANDACERRPRRAVSNSYPESLLLRRHAECRALDRLLDGVQAGQSRVLVLRGEPGVGKSALLDYLVRGASGCRVTRAAGVECEMELAYAGLHQLCAPVLELRERVPAPQREALEAAFGLSADPAPDRFRLGLAILGLMSEVAARQPLVCVVDDVQWLDQASAEMASLRRRVAPPRRAGSFCMRGPHRRSRRSSRRASQLAIEGLDDGDARACTGLRSRADRQRSLPTGSSRRAMATRWRLLSCRAPATPRISLVDSACP